MNTIFAIEKINKTREYLDSIEKHILNVKKAFEIVKNKCSDLPFMDNLFLHHLNIEVRCQDSTKLSEDVFIKDRQTLYPTSYENFPDIIDNLNEIDYHYTKVWPKTCEKHPKSKDMYKLYCTHMVINWMAKGFESNESIQEYYLRNQSEIEIPTYAKKFVDELIFHIESQIEEDLETYRPSM